MNLPNKIEIKTKQVCRKYNVCLNNFDEVTQIIKSALDSKSQLRIVTFNPEMLIAASKNKDFSEAIQTADLLLPDGIGLVKLLNKHSKACNQRLPGIEVAWKALELCSIKSLPIALFGSTNESLEGTTKKIAKTFAQTKIIFTKNGYFNDQELESIKNELLEIKPALVLLAMPFVKQELIAAELAYRGLNSVIIGVGGSFDVWAGAVKRAPILFQKIGLEWFWRLICQPERFGRLMDTMLPFLRIYLRE
jgi:N-acetylglucosaminyldiphosphoundecaprenol N-acetyl-beta-D-mannosaminyltransferase